MTWADGRCACPARAAGLRPASGGSARTPKAERAGAVGRVEQSRSPEYAAGDLVAGTLGWQDYAVVSAAGPAASRPVKLPPGVPIPLAPSALGLTGLTAYFGLPEIGRPKAGETVVVSGAAGATGSVAGQIARLKGCRVVGIAGGREKRDWLVREARFDAAVGYKSEDVAARLRELCPRGVDVYLDNVGGGEILDAALARLAMRGRVVLCGAISQYNATGRRARSRAGKGRLRYSNRASRGPGPLATWRGRRDRTACGRGASRWPRLRPSVQAWPTTSS